jgi:hypothetical protein
MLKHVRTKSEAEKSRYAFFVATLGTLVCAGVWMTAVVVYNDEEVSARESASIGSPLELIAEDISLMFKRADKVFVETNNVESNSPEALSEFPVYYDPLRPVEEFNGAIVVEHPRFLKTYDVNEDPEVKERIEYYKSKGMLE